MRKLILLLMVTLLVGAGIANPVIGKDKEKVELLLQWTQEIPPTNDLKGWNVLWSDKKGGPYILWQFVAFEREQSVYSLPLVFFSVKSSMKYYFVIQSINADKTMSGYSVEVEAKVDKDTTPPNVTPPVIPGDVQIVVKP